jgi:4a-hydroxytetrahydrobiopterin dehydratase
MKDWEPSMSEKENLCGEVCIPCSGGTPPMPMQEAMNLLKSLDKNWSINSVGHLERVVLLKNFSEAVRLTVSIGEIADKEKHHPDLTVSYGKLGIEIWTHKINGLSRADFVLAAKLDQIIHKK